MLSGKGCKIVMCYAIFVYEIRENKNINIHIQIYYTFMHVCVSMCSGSFVERNTGRINWKLWSPITDVSRGPGKGE